MTFYKDLSLVGLSIASGWKTVCSVALFCVATVVVSPAQFTRLVNFDGTDGSGPYSLVQGRDGNLYGTTAMDGANGYGTVFKVTPTGTLTTLYSFCAQTNCTDGAYPPAGLVLGTDGNFYGTTNQGGANSCIISLIVVGCGTVFKITSGGTLTTLHSFDGTDGASPEAGLIQATNGSFYGTTYVDGANDEGTVFEITPAGQLTTLYSFCSQANCTDGASPLAPLVQATNGTFYGTTQGGGANDEGTVFSITPGGTLTTLYNFCSQSEGGGYCTDGAGPEAGLIQATNGSFYGTTYFGGGQGGGAGDGTVFSITPGGTLTTLFSFDGTDGAYPTAALVQATNGTFYGTTSGYGGTVCTVFSITSGGTLTTLPNFNSTDGGFGATGLVQATNGTFYGTTLGGGANGYGTVFSLAVGLGQFVETLPTSGKVGAAVEILGTNLTGATSVTFNGTAAKFTVVSKSEIKTTVPTGATTGKVEVATSKKTLKSNVAFRVTK